LAARRAFPDAEIVFVDCSPAQMPRRNDPPILLNCGVVRKTFEFPTRSSDPLRLFRRKILTGIGRALFALLGIASEPVFGDRTQGLAKFLSTCPADLYIAHNVDTLPAVARVLRKFRAAIVFDCMEFYSGMGDGQSPLESKAVKRIESVLLPQCALVLASSDLLAIALSDTYGISTPLASYNVPPVELELPQKPMHADGLNLYWRNSVIGFGQRGLEDAIQALALLPSDVRLFLQGRLPPGNERDLNRLVETLKVADRVTILPPYAAGDAVLQAADFDIGLCLERSGPRNHDLTVSNKMFDYHMAGLAVVTSNLPSLAAIIDRSHGGLAYEAGNVSSLAEVILRLRSAPSLLRELQDNARRFALERANLEQEIGALALAFRSAYQAANRRPSTEA
jgi:glycosyltransferase involved in cell wall biosynthesis